MRVPPKVLCGVVVSAGKMMKAVKVRTAKQVYNSFVKKVCQSLILSLSARLHRLEFHGLAFDKQGLIHSLSISKPTSRISFLTLPTHYGLAMWFE